MTAHVYGRVQVRNGCVFLVEDDASSGSRAAVGISEMEGIEHLAGPEVPEAAARCAGPGRDIALFNVGSQVQVERG